MQNKDLARAIRELCERRLEVHRQIAGSRRRRRQGGEDLFAVVMALSSRGLGAEPLDDDVDGEPVEPRAEGRIATKAAEFLPIRTNTSCVNSSASRPPVIRRTRL